jgi:uncharacterized protein (DUF1330 family)
VALTICVLLTAVPGQEDALARYEDRVLALLPEYGGRVAARLRALDGDLTELQIIEFPHEQALDDFQRDPRRLELAKIRDSVIATTTITRVEPVDPGEG